MRTQVLSALVGGGITAAALLCFPALFGSGPEAPPSGAGVLAPTAATSTSTPPALEAPQRSAEVVRDVGAGELFSAALIAYFHRELAVHWQRSFGATPTAEESSAQEQRFREKVLDLPRTLASWEERARRDRAEAQAARAGLDAIIASQDGPALLELMEERNEDLGVFDRELSQLESWLAPRAQGGTLTGESFAQNGSAEDVTVGVEILFGPGLHDFDPARLKPKKLHGFPSDVTIRGVGIDRTLLRLSTDFDLYGRAHRFAFRDLTIDVPSLYFFDHRQGAVSLRLERVRVVGFDTGAGGSLAFGLNDGALLLATQCEFLGGYGSYPGSGNLWRGSNFIARFDNCRFALVNLELNHLGHGRALFRSCTFEEMRSDPQLASSSRARFDGCTTGALLDPAQQLPLPQKRLGDLFDFLR
ncbi:MAG: hypothetical protein JNM84_21260 [Planctomycetes bacterium]|nr:hypothetical protein [Planctomycetota bacterium]